MPLVEYSNNQLNRDKDGLRTAADFSAAQNRWINTTAGLGDAGVILTAAPLGASASYIQASQDRLIPMGSGAPAFPVGRVRGLAWADQAGTLYLEESDDNSIWLVTASVAVTAGTTTELPWTSLTKRWYRFRYANGGVAQGSFVLVQQASGLAVTRTELTGSTVPDSQALPMTQAQKDIAMRAYENIIDIIGAEKIKLLLPMWEASGTEFTDLLRPHVKFVAEGVTLGQTGLLHPVPSFDGVNDYVRQKPLTEATVSNSNANLNSPTKKLAQKLPAYALSGDVKFIMVRLQKTGSPSANLVVKIVEDSSGTPTGTVLATSASITAASTSTTARDHGLYFATPAECLFDKVYWLVMEYSSVTTVDANNYVSWGYDSAGAYGQPRAEYDGTTWSVTSGQSHKFAVYSDDLTLDSSFSILACAKPSNISNTALIQPAIGNTRSVDGGCMCLSAASNRHNLIVFKPGGGVSYFAEKQVLQQTSIFDLYAYTFSYEDSTSKLKLYRGAHLMASVNGTANSGPNPPQQPFVIGATRADWNEAWGYVLYLYGKIGPVIVSSNVLTQTQIGKIQNQLLSLRRIGSVV